MGILNVVILRNNELYVFISTFQISAQEASKDPGSSNHKVGANELQVRENIMLIAKRHADSSIFILLAKVSLYFSCNLMQ